MIRKTFPFVSLFLFLAILTYSCKKNKADIIDEFQTTFTLSGNQAVADNLVQDANDVLNEAAADKNLMGGKTTDVLTTTNTLSCATITVTGNFPAKNILVDFGTGCTSANGVLRKGKINIVLTDSLRKTGSVATLTFDNYYVNTYKKEGVITWTNTTPVNATIKSWNRQVANGKITAADGNFWMHTSNIDITQTVGSATPLNLLDDVFSIQGTRTVTNAAGKTRTSTTVTPLQKKANCTNIDSGILQVQGPNHVAMVDFGNGTCDNFAMVSIDGRTPVMVTLR